MKNEETKNLKVLIILLVIFGVFTVAYKFLIKNKEADNEMPNTTSISVVIDYNRFYTVSSCVSKYINYLTTKNTENLLILLSDEYQQKNNIDSENIYNYTGIIDGNKTFSAVKMFEQRIDETMYKYYVRGTLQEESINIISEKENYYLIVILDEENMTFAIEPYDGNVFK